MMRAVSAGASDCCRFIEPLLLRAAPPTPGTVFDYLTISTRGGMNAPIALSPVQLLGCGLHSFCGLFIFYPLALVSNKGCSFSMPKVGRPYAEHHALGSGF